MLPSVNKNSERESNYMLYPLYLYLFRSVFLVSFTNPENQFFNVKYSLINNMSIYQSNC